MDKNITTKKHTVRVGRHLKEVVVLHDDKGNVLHKILAPIMVEFHLRDVLQVIIGASLLAIPIAFTEETWKLGESLPLVNVLFLGIISFIFMSTFVYYNFYQGKHEHYMGEFIKRVIVTYLLAFLVVTLILFIIQRAPWHLDALLAFKRTVIVAFPASMSAAVADMIK